MFLPTYPLIQKRLIPLLGTLLLLALDSTSSRCEILEVPQGYPLIRDALTHAQHGDHVQIAPGYYPESNLQIPPGVTIAGMGDDPEAVILDGMGEGRIMTCESLDHATLIHNLTFQGGAVVGGESSYDNSGGAILLSNASPRIMNCVFLANRAESHGGAIRCNNSSPLIIHCRFESNEAPNGGGGALDLSYNSHPTITESEFYANIAHWGGALSIRGNSTATFYGCNFVSNMAQGVIGYGGVLLADFDAAPTFELCTFFDNEAQYGGVAASLKNSQIQMTRCTLVSNRTAWQGGAFICSESSPTIANSLIVYHEGASFFCDNGGLPVLTCSNIFGNSQGDWVGPISSQLPTNGNMAQDPLFCEWPPEDHSRFYLTADSPCSEEASSCGAIGAWDVYCGTSNVVDQNLPDALGPTAMTGIHPNPFNPSTTISLNLEKNTMVDLSIHDLSGRLVRRLVNGTLTAGKHELHWNGRDEDYRNCVSGIYLVRLTAENHHETRKITLLK